MVKVDADNEGLDKRALGDRSRGKYVRPLDAISPLEPISKVASCTFPMRGVRRPHHSNLTLTRSLPQNDRMIEMRVKFSVEGMHGVLTHKTPMPMTGPNAKKLAEPRWKTLLPLSM